MNSHLKELEERIAYEFKNKNLFTQALTHSSYANEHRLDHSRCNERLEFLGDAVLEIVTSEFLYRKYETLPEGDLTKIRASIVCEPTLAYCAGDIRLGEYLFLGKGEDATGGRGRNSVVSDPVFERKNTLTNTPAVIYTEIVEGDQVVIECAAKGFGSENCSRIKMCKPAEGVEGVRDFILETVKLAGPNACPPMVVGVGVGGTMDYAAYLAKRALVRPLDSENENEQYRQLERECLEQINQLNIGPMGLKGRTTALKVNIEWFPTHIAGMPVAVNINCHVTRHKKVVP